MISQTIEYALRAMTMLAAAPVGTSETSESIATRTKVPQGYLSKVLRDLVVAGLISSQRGPNGGFTLARLASQVSLLDIVEAVDPLQRIRHCPLGNPDHLSLCPLHQRLDDALLLIEQQFKRTSLAEVIESGTPDILKKAGSSSSCGGCGRPPA